MGGRGRRQPFRGAREGAAFLWRARGPGGSRPLHRHGGWELNLGALGAATYLVGGRRVRLGPRTLLWLAPEVPHAVLDYETGFQMWVVWLARRPGPGPSGREVPARVLAPRMHEELVGLCRTASAHADDRSVTRSMLKAIAALADRAWRDAERPGGSGDVHPAATRAASVLRESGGSVELAEVASRSGLSLSRLSHVFAEETGMRLVEFRNACRLERFAELREERPQATLLSLALASGFGSYMQFYRVHRRVTGRRPSEGPARARERPTE